MIIKKAELIKKIACPLLLLLIPLLWLLLIRAYFRDGADAINVDNKSEILFMLFATVAGFIFSLIYCYKQFFKK